MKFGSGDCEIKPKVYKDLSIMDFSCSLKYSGYCLDIKVKNQALKPWHDIGSGQDAHNSVCDLIHFQLALSLQRKLTPRTHFLLIQSVV